MSTENVSTNLRLNFSLEDLSYDKYKYTFYYIILHSLKNYFTSSILKLTIPSYRAQKPSFTSSKFITKEFGLLSQIIDNDSLHILHLSTNKELIASSRYSDILPYKHNEVELSTGNLINASYIHTPFINSFIATQYPIKALNDFFYEMLIEKKIKYIVMLTNSENTTSNEYWKNSTSHYSIKYTQKIHFNDSIIIRKFEINNTVEITQINFINWKDHSALNIFDTYQSFLDIFHVIDDHFSKEKSPILVHCNAGVGRTGTFIAMYNLYYELCLLNQKEISVWNTVRKLKEMRRLMVENEEQYRMVYQFTFMLMKNILKSSLKKNINV